MSQVLQGTGETAVSASVVELSHITVRYGDFEALRDVSLSLPRGATGLVGRNGAGKSTLMRLLLGLISPTAGTGRVLGISIDRAGRLLRRTVGTMPENDAFLPGMKAVEQVTLAGELCRLGRRESIRRAHEVLSYTGLGEARYRNVETFSTGMKQRLKLAVALVHDPELLLLDEPTVGLDPPGRMRMLDLIDDLVRTHGKSLIISTHLLADIEHTCDHIVMVERGKVIASGSMSEIIGVEGGKFLLEWEGDDATFVDSLIAAGGVIDELSPVEDRGAARLGRSGKTVVKLPADFDTRLLFDIAHAAGVRLRVLDREHEDLGELYHRLLKRESQYAG